MFNVLRNNVYICKSYIKKGCCLDQIVMYLGLGLNDKSFGAHIHHVHFYADDVTLTGFTEQ